MNIVSLTAATGTSIVRSLTQVNHGEINTLAAAIVVIPACQILVFFGARSMMIFLEGTDTGLVKLWSRVGGNQGIPGGSGYQPGNRPRSWLPPVTRRGLGLILGPTGQSSPPGNHRSLVPKPGNRAGSWFPKKNYPQPCSPFSG